MENQLFTMLKQDHQEARKLMEDILYADADSRHELFIDLNDALLLHLQIEEQNFYPKLQNHKRLVPAMKDALREHQETKDLLQELDRMNVEKVQWDHTFRLMQQGLLKHMQIEEGDVFEKCTEFLSSEDLDEIARKCRDQKQSRQQPGKGRPQPETRT